MRLHQGLLLGAVALLVLALGTWLVMPPVALDSGPARDEQVASAPQERPAPSPVGLPSRPPSSAGPSRAPVARPPPGMAAEKTPETPRAQGDAEVLPPGPDTRRDRFEPQNGEDPEILTLLSVGDIRMGAVRGAEIHDEAALRAVLVRIGEDLERRMKETRPQRELGYQEILDGYRDEMARFMTGMIEMRGPHFMIGTEVGPPLPREKWWRPRPQ